MRTLLLCLVVFLTACSNQLTLISPPVPPELRVKCGDSIAEPVTTGDQLDTARALVQSVKYGLDCRSRHAALVDAIDVRDQIMASVKMQLEKR